MQRSETEKALSDQKKISDYHQKKIGWVSNVSLCSDKKGLAGVPSSSDGQVNVC